MLVGITRNSGLKLITTVKLTMPKAVKQLREERQIPQTTQLRAVRFGAFNIARRTLKGYEAMLMIRKGQICGVERNDVTGRISFIHELSGVAI